MEWIEKADCDRPSNLVRCVNLNLLQDAFQDISLLYIAFHMPGIKPLFAMSMVSSLQLLPTNSLGHGARIHMFKHQTAYHKTRNEYLISSSYPSAKPHFAMPNCVLIATSSYFAIHKVMVLHPRLLQ